MTECRWDFAVDLAVYSWEVQSVTSADEPNANEDKSLSAETPSSTNDRKEYLDFYWRMIVHENALINYRFFWGVFVNAGLLAFYGSTILVNEEYLRALVASFGLAWSILIALMCMAASYAERESLNRIEKVLRKWPFPKDEIHEKPLTTLRGGGSTAAHLVAAICSFLVYWAMVLFWIGLLVAQRTGKL